MPEHVQHFDTAELTQLPPIAPYRTGHHWPKCYYVFDCTFSPRLPRSLVSLLVTYVRSRDLHAGCKGVQFNYFTLNL